MAKARRVTGFQFPEPQEHEASTPRLIEPKFERQGFLSFVWACIVFGTRIILVSLLAAFLVGYLPYQFLLPKMGLRWSLTYTLATMASVGISNGAFLYWKLRVLKDQIEEQLKSAKAEPIVDDDGLRSSMEHIQHVLDVIDELGMRRRHLHMVRYTAANRVDKFYGALKRILGNGHLILMRNDPQFRDNPAVQAFRDAAALEQRRSNIRNEIEQVMQLSAEAQLVSLSDGIYKIKYCYRRYFNYLLWASGSVYAVVAAYLWLYYFLSMEM